MPSRRAAAFASIALIAARAGSGTAQSTTVMSGFVPGSALGTARTDSSSRWTRVAR